MRNFDPIITCIPPTVPELTTSSEHQNFHVDNFDYTATANGGTSGGGGRGAKQTNGTPGGEGGGRNGTANGTPGGGGEGTETDPSGDWS